MDAPLPGPVALCAGSDCAKDRRKDFRRLRAGLDGVDVVTTKCMGVCHGPVVVLGAQSETPVVVERIRSAKQVKALRRLARRGGSVPDRLRVVTKPKKRRKAIARAQVA